MRLKSIELHYFKPLMHNGTRHVIVNDIPNITVIAGENGSGKSSLLRECTPYPACRTDYDKNGYKKVVYEHNGSTYELTSDFSKSQGAHSFMKDGLELNESGTTEVQEDLVETYFDYNDVIQKLVSGKYKICDMGKPERKTLIMSTYPSSMSFMLDYYKVIASKLRSLSANIKMLSQREMSLKGQLISPTILNDYKRQRDDLNKAVASIDVDVMTINDNINKVNKLLESVSYSILQRTPDSFIGKMKSIQQRLISLLRTHADLPDASHIKIILERMATMRAALDSRIKEDNASAVSIREEIDKYENYLNTDTNANIKECKSMIEVQETVIKNTPVDKDVPFITREEADRLTSNLETLQETLLQLKQSVTPFWSEDQYRSIEIQLSSLKQSVAQCNSSLVRVNESIELLEIKKAKYGKNSWPKDCKRVCPLRESFEDIIKNVDQQLINLKAERDKIGTDRATMLSQFEELKKDIEQRTADREILSELRKYYLSVSWSSYALSGKDLIDALNSDITKIYNNNAKVLSNAEKALRVKEATDLKVALEAKLTNLENNAAPAAQLIKDSLIKKEHQLNELIEKINASKSKILELERNVVTSNMYESLVAEAESTQSDYAIWKKTYTLQQEIKLYRGYIEEIMTCRYKLQDKLRELDGIIQEQDNYTIRLKDEVLVNLQAQQKEYDELAIIEAQLSPTKGIPHLYTVKYINSIFKIANEYIKRVWSYDMELAYITEGDESFDYSFKVLLNGNSEVKDVNMLSNGQKSIVNLAFRLAICLFRQYSLIYPLILDEISDGISLNHSANLVLFLSELFQQSEQVSQAFVVDHNVSISSSFASMSQMINLSKDSDISDEWKQIGEIS